MRLFCYFYNLEILIFFIETLRFFSSSRPDQDSLPDSANLTFSEMFVSTVGVVYSRL